MGTPEQQAKRFELVGNANPQLASYPLGVLLARKLITQDEHNAGRRYGMLCHIFLGYGPQEPAFGYGPDPKRDARVEREWRQCADALRAVGRERADVEVKRATDTVCVFELPYMDITPVKTGLRTLHKVFYGVRANSRH